MIIPSLYNVVIFSSSLSMLACAMNYVLKVSKTNFTFALSGGSPEISFEHAVTLFGKISLSSQKFYEELNKYSYNPNKISEFGILLKDFATEYDIQFINKIGIQNFIELANDIIDYNFDNVKGFKHAKDYTINYNGLSSIDKDIIELSAGLFAAFFCIPLVTSISIMYQLFNYYNFLSLKIYISNLIGLNISKSTEFALKVEKENVDYIQNFGIKYFFIEGRNSIFDKVSFLGNLAVLNEYNKLQNSDNASKITSLIKKSFFYSPYNIGFHILESSSYSDEDIKEVLAYELASAIKNFKIEQFSSLSIKEKAKLHLLGKFDMVRIIKYSGNHSLKIIEFLKEAKIDFSKLNRIDILEISEAITSNNLEFLAELRTVNSRVDCDLANIGAVNLYEVYDKCLLYGLNNDVCLV